MFCSRQATVESVSAPYNIVVLLFTVINGNRLHIITYLGIFIISGNT